MLKLTPAAQYDPKAAGIGFTSLQYRGFRKWPRFAKAMSGFCIRIMSRQRIRAGNTALLLSKPASLLDKLQAP